MEVMNRTFFTEDEDLCAVLSQKFPNIRNENIKKISTGWTNIVLEINLSNQSYIAKLPRDDYWSKQIVKDANVSNFVRNNLQIKTADMQIEYDKNRPFSIHKKLGQTALTEKLNDLDSEKIEKIAKTLAKIFYTFHSFDISKLPIEFKNKYFNFISNLPKINEKQYDFSYFNDMIKDEEKEEQVFIHGDLNIGNVILNEKYEVEAIIDYAFSSLGDIYSDLSIFSCRVNEEFFDIILKEYQKISNKKLDIKKMENRKKLRQYIEKEYIAFMKIQHPEVKI